MKILNMSYDEIEKYVISKDHKSFRAKQIYEWLHKKNVVNFNEMTNLSKDLINSLSEDFEFNNIEIVEKYVSDNDGTEKYLFKLYDGNIVETVLMKHNYGNTICISTQVGCKMGCEFCASTKGGLVRNLDMDEILLQVYNVNRENKISNIVIMGIGEPLDNYDNVIGFLKTIIAKDGLNISQRNITISTCGLVERINDFAKEDLKVTLAISLHAPNDKIRKTIMKIANAYSISDIIKASENYFNNTGRRITFEYALIKGINDSNENANELAYILRNLNTHVNLIPMNEIKESEFQKSDNIENFSKILTKKGINNTVRKRLGNDIDASCGQLRKKYIDGNGEI